MGYKKIIQSGDLLEIYEYKHTYIPRFKNTRKGEVFGRRSPSRNRRPDNLFRLTKGFVRLVRSNLVRKKAPLLVTCTFAEKVDVVEGYCLFSRFIRLLRSTYGKTFSYVAVPEFQKRGSIHFHILFWDLLITPKHERKYRIIQRHWGQGFVDCVTTDSSPKLAKYLGKYLFKTLRDERLGGKKAYSASRNILRPVQKTFNGSNIMDSVIVGDSIPERVVYYDTQWLGACKYSEYVF